MPIIDGIEPENIHQYSAERDTKENGQQRNHAA
jgi:hypothetical protein